MPTEPQNQQNTNDTSPNVVTPAIPNNTLSNTNPASSIGKMYLSANNQPVEGINLNSGNVLDQTSFDKLIEYSYKKLKISIINDDSSEQILTTLDKPNPMIGVISKGAINTILSGMDLNGAALNAKYLPIDGLGIILGFDSSNNPVIIFDAVKKDVGGYYSITQEIINSPGPGPTPPFPAG